MAWPNHRVRSRLGLEYALVLMATSLPLPPSTTVPESLPVESRPAAAHLLAPSAATCPPYGSKVQIPSTIAVYDYSTVQVYSFNYYVKHTLPNEWGPISSFSEQSLQAGAVWIIQFAWYLMIHNGRTANGQCYDVTTPTDQDFVASNPTYSRTDEAVDSVWSAARIYRRSAGQDADVLYARYWSGTQGQACGSNPGGEGWQSTQFGSQTCAASGIEWPGISRRYYYNACCFPAGVPSGHVTILDDAPTATEYNAGAALESFALDRSGQVWQNISWAGWQTNLSGPNGSCSSNPNSASVPFTTTDLWVFCRANDQTGTIYGDRSTDGHTWSGWQALTGGSLMSAPAATDFPYGSQKIYVFAVAWSGDVWQDIYDTSTRLWSGWALFGSPTSGCTSSPGTDWLDTNHFYVFCRGTDGVMYFKMWDGSAWEAWTATPQGGVITTAPGPTDYWNGATWQINVWADVEDGEAYQNYKPSAFQDWQGWSSFGGRCASAPDSTELGSSLYLLCRWDPGDLGAFDSAIHYRVWNGSQWLGWTAAGRP